MLSKVFRFYNSQLTREFDQDHFASAADALAEASDEVINKAKTGVGLFDEDAEIDEDEEDDEDVYTARLSYGAHSYTPSHFGSHGINVWGRPTNGSGSLEICILGRRTFDFDGVTYATVQNAFQAQKAQPAERSKFANILPTEAVRLGRCCDIVFKTWDTNKVALMSSIILAQAEQHGEMAETLIKYKDKHIAETVICDGFWDVELPKIYKSVGRMLDAQAADCKTNPASTATVQQPKLKKRRVA